MTIRLALLTAAVLVILFPAEGAASNGLKPTANGTRSLGRGGSDIAWSGSATSMYSNPALLAEVWDEQFDVAPVLLRLNARYSDAENSSVTSDTDFFPYANFAVAFDISKTEAEILEDLRETDPYFKMLDRQRPKRPDVPPEPIFGFGKVVHKNVPISVGKMPRSVTVTARGKVATIYNISVVANYMGADQKPAYSNIVATQESRKILSDRSTTVAHFPGLVNPLPEAPAEIVVYFTLDVEFKSSGETADVRVLLDGADAGGTTASWEDVKPVDAPPEPEPDQPRFDHETWNARKELSPIKFGIGTVVQAGAGADFKLRTDLYPEGVRHFAEFSFISAAPTVAVRLFDFLSIGASVYINYSTMAFDTPITQPVEVMAGPLFPAGSLDVLLGGVFGIPAQFGPAMKYTLDTSDTHAPGTSITHVAKPNDPAFSKITGTAKVRESSAIGMGLRFGLLATVTDRLKIGLTVATPSMQQDYKGKSTIDYDRQIAAFIANPTYGHSNEVLVLGIPTEMRFTFDQTWTQGVVDVWTSPFGTPILTFPNFPLPNGSIVGSLPNGGANGFRANYDLLIRDFQLPAEIGFGATYRLFDWLTVGADVKYVLWSRAMDDFRVDLKNGDNPDVNALIGSSNLPVTLPLDWDDQIVISIGVEVIVTDWLTLRAGWNYGKNPIPEETVLPIAPAITENHGSFGFSIRVGSFSFDAAYQHAFENSITVGQSLQSTDLNGSTLSVEQDSFTFGLTYEW